MSRLEELIQEYCPDGVEYLALWKITSWDKKFNSVKKERQPTKENFKHVSSKIIKELKCNGDIVLLSTGMFEGTTTLEKAQNYLNEGEVIAIPSGGNATVKYNKGKFVDSGNFLASTNQNTKYVYYYLLNNLEFIQNCYRGSGIKHPDMSKILELEIPVPPLPVQQEIVHILDSFTTLTAELEAELEARKKQYEFYHKNLMDFTNENVEYKLLGDLFEIKNGLNKSKDAFGHGSPIVNFTDVYNKRYLDKDSFHGLVDVTKEEIDRYSAKKGDVFFTRTSETKEDIGMSSTLIEDIENCVFSGFVLRARPITNLLLPKFCSYYFSTQKVRNVIVRYASFTTRATTSGPKLSKIPVPILPIEEQQRIVSILDRFDALCNDISSGLPAEIEARQKQYEYYRDKLLTFKRLDGDE